MFPSIQKLLLELENESKWYVLPASKNESQQLFTEHWRHLFLYT